MIIKRKEMQIEKAKDDGNCLLNAFLLGLTQSHIQAISQHNPDETLKDFITAAAKKLNVPANWANVSKAMVALKQKNKEEFQQLLAPVLREIVIQQVKNDPNHIYFDTTLAIIGLAYQEYLTAIQAGRLPKERDDIFSKYQFLQDKFYELVVTQTNGKTAEEALEALQNWWKDEGYLQFLNIMAQDKQWLGAQELGELSRYFKINIDIYKQKFKKDKNGIDQPTNDYIEMKNACDVGMTKPIMALVHSGNHWDLVVSVQPAIIQKQVPHQAKASETIEKAVPPVPKKHQLEEEPQVPVVQSNTNSYVNELLALLEKKDSKIQPNDKPWEQVVNEVVQSSASENDEKVKYHLSDTEEKIVTKKMQEDLDAEYAKRLQQEEYRAYLATKKPRR